MPRTIGAIGRESAFIDESGNHSNFERLQAFRRRQEADLMRIKSQSSLSRRPYQQHNEVDQAGDLLGAYEKEVKEPTVPWRNADGDTLDDFGVDAEIDLNDEADKPLQQVVGDWKVG